MSNTIKDGGGSGRLAKVDEHGYLEVAAISIEHSFHHAKYHKNLFASFHKHTIQVGNTDEYIAYGVYTGPHLFVVTSILFTTNEPTAGTNFKVYMNSTTIGGGATVIPFNMNFSSKQGITGSTLDSNDGATPITVGVLGTEIWEYNLRLQDTYFYHTENTLLMTANNNIIITAKASAGTKIRCTITGFEESD